MQLYAARFPNDFEGVVLVDSSHPDQVHRTSDLKEIEGLVLALKVLGRLDWPGCCFLCRPEIRIRATSWYESRKGNY